MTHQQATRTLRDLAGLASDPTPLEQSTLVVIDAQLAYSRDGALPLPDIAPASERLAELLDHARRHSVPVIHVAHVGGAGSPFDPVDGGRFLPSASPVPGEVVVTKSLPNAFAGTTLLNHVEQLGRPLAICGFMTHMCVSSTARAALDLGLDTNVIADASATRPLHAPVSGDVIAASVVHDASLAALADRFCVVAPTRAFLTDDRHGFGAGGDAFGFDGGYDLIDDVGQCDLGLIAGGSGREFGLASLDALGTDGDAPGDTNEFDVGELDASSSVTIVEHHVDATFAECLVDVFAGLNRCVVAHAHEHDGNFEWSDGHGPDHAVVVVVGLDDARHGPAYADAVAAHDRGLLLAVVVEHGHAHCLGVLRAELEDVSGFDATDHAECGAAVDAGLAGDRGSQVHELVDSDIALDRDASEMLVVDVGAGRHVGATSKCVVCDDANAFDADGAETSGHGSERLLCFFGRSWAQVDGLETVDELLLVQTVIATDQSQHDIAVGDHDHGLDLTPEPPMAPDDASTGTAGNDRCLKIWMYASRDRQRSVGQSEDSAGSSWCVAVDQIAHDLQGDVCKSVGADSQSQSGPKDPGVTDQEAEAAARRQEGGAAVTERQVEVCVVGSANLDIVVPVPHHPVAGETVLGGDHARIPGGKGANQAVAAARLGRSVGFIGCVGNDPAGHELALALESDGVDLRHLRTVPNTPSGIALISVGPDGDNSIVVSPGANAHVDLTDLDAASSMLQTALVTLLQLEVPVDTITEAAESAGGLVLLNPAPAQALTSRLLESVDILIPNETELALLSGSDLATTFDEIVDQARLLPAARTVVTLGAQGALLVDETEVRHQPAPKVNAVDTTAAGDAFCGALADVLAEGGSLTDAVAWGVMVGAATTLRHGAQTSLPTAGEVADLLELP
ncbi:Ribokinase [Nymphon striatum]|nr:Ribokinase [Nymphon striatum]